MRSLSLVLANLMNSRAELNSESIARINLATDFERFQESNLIILCGWAYRPDSDIAIADAMKCYLLENHPDFVHKAVSQRMSRDTVGDAVFSRIYIDKFVGNCAFDVVNIFTSDYHVARTEEIFTFVFGDKIPVLVRGAPGFDDEQTKVKEENSLRAFRSTFSGVLPGDLQSIYVKLQNSHPFYNGVIFPKILGMCEVISQLKPSY